MNDHRDDQAITTTGFGTEQTAIQRETSSTAMAERAKAQITARYIMALQRPRNIDRVRQTLLHECERPKFAEAARYRIPRGDGMIEGPTIRFAEAAIRAMTNLAIETTVISDDSRKTVLHISVTDLESNVPYETEVSVSKTTERKKLRKGQTALSTRKNSYGETVFLVEATDDEVLMKTNALISKAVRTLGLRHLPGDIFDEAMERCQETMTKRDKADPDGARKALLDAFFKIGVDAEQLELYLGHKPNALTPAELDDLRLVYAAVRDGDASWQAIIATKTGEVPDGAKDGAEANAQAKRTKEILDKKRREKAERSKTPSQPKNEAPPAGENERAAENPDDPDSYG